MPRSPKVILSHLRHNGCITEKEYEKLYQAVDTITKWIPTSERLPKDKTYVMTTIRVPGRQPHVRSGWYQYGLFMNDNGDTWKSTDIEVIAWMPLAKPYESEGKNADSDQYDES